ncbi:MAG: glutathionylspermidine synthase family protein [Alsobacter sp.]
MRRLPMRARPDWRDIALREGFDFHQIDGSLYWDETACYAFSLREIEEDLEAPTAELHGLCLAAVETAVADERWMDRLGVPAWARDAVAASWRAAEPSLYGRFDLSYDGTGPAKLLEYNADTPTALYETGYFQWRWLEDLLGRGWLPEGTDQFNSVHDRLIARWGEIAAGLPEGGGLHLACMGDAPEDRGTIAYLEDCARQAGLSTRFLDIARIGITGKGGFVGEADEPIDLLFKLYPWEWMLAESYGKAVPACGTRFVEPLWKTLLSNKGLLVLLWELFPGHPNLLPAFFEDDPRAADLGDSFARKPVHSREGANVRLTLRGETVHENAGPYGDGLCVRQALAPLGFFQQNYVCVGSWVIGNEPAGIGLREDASPVTGNGSRFLPHIIRD